jgi:hypothetical protein
MANRDFKVVLNILIEYCFIFCQIFLAYIVQYYNDKNIKMGILCISDVSVRLLAIMI